MGRLHLKGHILLIVDFLASNSIFKKITLKYYLISTTKFLCLFNIGLKVKQGSAAQLVTAVGPGHYSGAQGTARGPGDTCTPSLPPSVLHYSIHLRMTSERSQKKQLPHLTG
jgi:hypothetical protein